MGEDEDGDAITSMVVVQSDVSVIKGPSLGKRQAAVIQAVELLTGLTGEPAMVAEVISRAAESEIHDPGLDPAKPRRDRRRDMAMRALSDVIRRGLVVETGGLLSLPHPHKTP